MDVNDENRESFACSEKRHAFFKHFEEILEIAESEGSYEN